MSEEKNVTSDFPPENITACSPGQVLNLILTRGIGRPCNGQGSGEAWTRAEFAQAVAETTNLLPRQSGAARTKNIISAAGNADEPPDNLSTVNAWLDSDAIPSNIKFKPPYQTAVLKTLFAQGGELAKVWESELIASWRRVRDAKTMKSKSKIVEPNSEFTKPFSKKSAHKAVDLEDIGMDHVRTLMETLCEVFPNELDDFFYQTPSGNRLPFWLMDPSQFGTPQFPMPIVDTPEYPKSYRGNDSLASQKKMLGSKLYDGNIYRLIRAAEGGWTIARTLYTELIDSCDYLRARILGQWGKLMNEGAHNTESHLTHSVLVKEWRSNVKSIKEGNFSNYLAGMAFTIPIFQVESDGSLTLFMGKTSNKKASAPGKFHCIPAGMLEFGAGDMSASELSYEDWRIYALKELIEETLQQQSDISFSLVKMLGQDERDFYNPQSLESVIKQIMSDWNGSPDALRPAQIFGEREWGEQPFFAIVDAFRLRPEFIFPMFIKEDIQVLPNWEYKGRVAHKRRFKNYEEAEEVLTNELTQWAEPGLAGALLSAKYWFENN